MRRAVLYALLILLVSITLSSCDNSEEFEEGKGSYIYLPWADWVIIYDCYNDVKPPYTGSVNVMVEYETSDIERYKKDISSYGSDSVPYVSLLSSNHNKVRYKDELTVEIHLNYNDSILLYSRTDDLTLVYDVDPNRETIGSRYLKNIVLNGKKEGDGFTVEKDDNGCTLFIHIK